MGEPSTNQQPQKQDKMAWEDLTKKQKFLAMIGDSVSDLLYYDRKECKTFSPGDIENLIKSGEITVEEMVSEFRRCIDEAIV